MTAGAPVRRGPNGHRARAQERATEAAQARRAAAVDAARPPTFPIPPPPIPVAAHVPYSWTCAGCGRQLAVTNVIPAPGTALDLRCPVCGTDDRLAVADGQGVVINAARRVLYAPTGVDQRVGALYRPGRTNDGGQT